MPDSLYETSLQGIVVVVLIKTSARLANVECKFHDSQARMKEGIGHLRRITKKKNASRLVIAKAKKNLSASLRKYLKDPFINLQKKKQKQRQKKRKRY